MNIYECRLRMEDAASATITNCEFAHNGLLGGAAVKMSQHVSVNVSCSEFVCGKSVSPTFPRVAAFEASVSSCTTLHHTAPHCSKLHRTAPHCTTLYHAAPHCITLHHTR